MTKKKARFRFFGVVLVICTLLALLTLEKKTFQYLSDMYEADIIHFTRPAGHEKCLQRRAAVTCLRASPPASTTTTTLPVGGAVITFGR